jgi:hypothetical protein
MQNTVQNYCDVMSFRRQVRPQSMLDLWRRRLNQQLSSAHCMS